jgi:hypothetical protein
VKVRVREIKKETEREREREREISYRHIQVKIMSDELKACSYLHRLQILQNLCRGSNLGDPRALLIIPGIDGRNNKESMVLLKFICGFVGREILDNSVVDDALEEIVLLIQESSVSVIYNSAAKKIIGPILSSSPFLIEYMPLLEEEEEVPINLKCDHEKLC